ncbi:MAG TPA: hypothetical protein VM939_11265, partial [Gemmatimonadaceae bacterium]|nr:hypothetical protein [Gemmatimonadaceae bacterium]
MRDEFGLDRWWRLILIWSIGAVTTWVIATLSLNRLPPAGSPHSPPKSAQEALSNWDGKHYAAVAANGYQAKGDAARLVNFFPLYPALARAFGGSKHSLLAGILLSQLLVLCSIMLMSHLAHGKQRESLLVEPGLWLLVNPFGFYMFAAYAESLFLFLTLVHVTAYSMRRASASAFAGLLAGLTRPVAIILPALVGVDAIQRWKRGERTWKPFLVAATPLFGFLLFTLVYVGWIFGDAGAYWNIVATYWTQTPVFPFTTFIADLQSWLTTAADGRIPPPDMILRTFST